MYSRSTDRGGKRIKLPPGYDGSAFRHDTGEIRRLAEETEMKIHSPDVWEGEAAVQEPECEEESRKPEPASSEAEEKKTMLPTEKRSAESFMDGLLAELGSEEWLLFLVILLLAVDGSDCWDVILLLGLLLAVRGV